MSLSGQQNQSALEENCNKLLFHDLCMKFDKIEKTKTADAKCKIIFNSELSKLVGNQSVFPLMRLLLPINDSERHRYNIKQQTMAKIYVKCLGLDTKSKDAQRLILFKDPTKAFVGSGDFCTVLEDVLKSRVQSEPSTLNIGQVNEVLDKLADAPGDGKAKVVKDEILSRFSANEQKWLNRIIFQDLKIGLKLDQILKRYSPTALDRYNECTNLKKLCEDEAAGVSTISGLKIFSKFAPMLSKGFPNSGQIIETERSMKGHDFIMETKLDGERMSCHISNNKVMLWSRRGNDYSSQYSSVCSDISTSVPPGWSVILDGEMCAWDSINSKFIKFGHNRTVARHEKEKAGTVLGTEDLNDVKVDGDNEDEDLDFQMRNSNTDDADEENSDDESGRKSKSIYNLDDANDINVALSSSQTTPSSSLSTYRLIYIVFDILYLDGRGALDLIRKHVSKFNHHQQIEDHSVHAGDLCELPLIIRKSILNEVLTPYEGRVEFVKSVECHSRDVTTRRNAIMTFFDEAVNNHEEGIIVKDLFSTYILGTKSRAMAAWVKMKPDYAGMTRDLDLIILGGYFGEGKGFRGQGINSFLVGVKKTSNPEDNEYLTLTKVASGLTFDELQDLRDRLGKNWVTCDAKNPPPHFTLMNIPKADIPDKWIAPQHSVILQVLCAEITVFNTFSSGFSLRFPRIECIRYDKYPYECTTIDQLREIYRSPMVSLKPKYEDYEDSKRQKKKAMTSKRKRDELDFVPEQFRVYGDGDVEDKDSVHILKGWKCVVAGESFEVTPEFLSTLNEEYPMPAATQAPKKYSRGDIIKLLQKLGAEVVGSSNSRDVITIVGNQMTQSIANLLKDGYYDVMNFQYLIELERVGGYISPKPHHYLGMKPETKTLFDQHFDVIGDSFVEPITEKELKTLLQRMDKILPALQQRVHASTSSKRARTGDKNGECVSVLSAEERNVIEDFDSVTALSWREIAEAFTDEDGRQVFADILDGQEVENLPADPSGVTGSYNSLWRNHTKVYLDMDSADRKHTGDPLVVSKATEDPYPLSQSSVASSSSSPAKLNTKPGGLLPRGAVKRPLLKVRNVESSMSSSAVQSPERPLQPLRNGPTNQHTLSTLPAVSSTAVPPADSDMLILWSFESILKFRGALVSPVLSADVTHVVVSSNLLRKSSDSSQDMSSDSSRSPALKAPEIERIQTIKLKLKELRLDPNFRFEKRIVTEDWIRDCLSSNTLIVPSDNSSYVIK